MRIEISNESGKYVEIITKLCKTGRANEGPYTVKESFSNQVIPTLICIVTVH